MNYQAVIRNSSGTLIANQSVGIRIKILQGSANGSAVYNETLALLQIPMVWLVLNWNRISS